MVSEALFAAGSSSNSLSTLFFWFLLWLFPPTSHYIELFPKVLSYLYSNLISSYSFNHNLSVDVYYIFASSSSPSFRHIFSISYLTTYISCQHLKCKMLIQPISVNGSTFISITHSKNLNPPLFIPQSNQLHNPINFQAILILPL